MVELKLIQGRTLEDQLKSIDSHLSSLQTRRYNIVKELVPEQIIQDMNISIRIPVGGIGTYAFALSGSLTSITCVSPALIKDSVLVVTIIDGQQTTINKFSVQGGKVKDMNIPISIGSEIDITLVDSVKADIHVGLIFRSKTVQYDGGK